MKTERGKVDAWNIAWFEMWRRLKKTAPQKTIEEIREKFFAATKGKGASNFFRFVYLRTYLDSVRVERTLSLNKELTSSQLESIIHKFPRYCLDMEKELFTKMFKKI